MRTRFRVLGKGILLLEVTLLVSISPLSFQLALLVKKSKKKERKKLDRLL